MQINRLKVLKSRHLLSILLCSLSVSTLAKGIYSAQNGDTISATISANDLTRIEISDQKIIKDFSSANISKKITKPLGQIYLIPNTNTTFNLYIVGDKGNTYNLRLTPSKNTAGDSIIINPMPSSVVQTNKIPLNTKASTYIRDLNYLMQTMYLNKDDAYYTGVDINQSIITYNGLDSVLLRKYISDSLTGFVLLLKNTSKNKITLSEAQFYSPNTLAVAIEAPELLVNKFTRVFIIKEVE